MRVFAIIMGLVFSTGLVVLFMKEFGTNGLFFSVSIGFVTGAAVSSFLGEGKN